MNLTAQRFSDYDANDKCLVERERKQKERGLPFVLVLDGLYSEYNGPVQIASVRLPGTLY